MLKDISSKLLQSRQFVIMSFQEGKLSWLREKICHVSIFAHLEGSAPSLPSYSSLSSLYWVFLCMEVALKSYFLSCASKIANVIYLYT